MRRRCLWAAITAMLLAACGAGGAPTGVATNPVAPGSGVPATASPSPSALSGVRTVLSPLGLNIHITPALTAKVLGTAAQGAELTVVDHSDQNGGWFKVQGQTVTGWITADPSLTAPGSFTTYQSSDRGFNALYPQDWTFDASTTAVIFRPQNGPQTIVVRGGAKTSDFGAAGAAGYVGAGQQTVVVCGVTGDLNLFTHSGAVTATPAPGSAGPLARLAQIRLRLDATHALGLDFNYSAAPDLDIFAAFYNSMTFPFPLCMQAAPAASP
jgi:uncharacterized protein YgiM (DUF1202 family)